MGFFWTLFLIFVVVVIAKRIREQAGTYRRRRKKIRFDPEPPAPQASATKQLLRQIASHDPAEVKAALHGLVTLGEDAAPELRQALHDVDPLVRSAAAQALRRLHREDPIDLPPVDETPTESGLVIDAPPRVRTKDTVVEVDAPPRIDAPPSIVAEETWEPEPQRHTDPVPETETDPVPEPEIDPEPVPPPRADFDPTRLASAPPRQTVPPGASAASSAPSEPPTPIAPPETDVSLEGALGALKALSRLDPERREVEQTLTEADRRFRIAVREVRATTDFDASAPFKTGSTILGTLEGTEQAVLLRVKDRVDAETLAAGTVVEAVARLARWDDLYERGVFEGTILR